MNDASGDGSARGDGLDESPRFGVEVPRYGENADTNVVRADFNPKSKFVARNRAREGLARSEGAAATPISALEQGSNTAKTLEEGQPKMLFTGSGLPDGKKQDKRDKKKGFWRKGGPLLTILLILLGGGGLALGAQTLMPFATADRIIQEFNSMQTVMSRRTDAFLRFQLDTERYQAPTRQTIFTGEKFSLTSKQMTKLGTKGIGMMEVDLNGRKVRLLTYDEGNGELQLISTKSDKSKLNADELLAAAREANPDAKFKSGLIDIDEAFQIGGFRDGYLESSRTWRGTVSGWFDSLVTKIFKRLGISRSRFNSWKQTGDIEARNEEFRKLASGDVKEEGSVMVSGQDEEGNAIESDGQEDEINSGDTKEEVQTKLRKKAEVAARALGGFSDITYVTLMVGNAINAIAVANEINQVLNYATGYLEASQKVEAGEGSGSPMDYYTRQLTTPDENGRVGMEAAGIGLLFGSETIDLNNASVSKYNLENGTKVLGRTLGLTNETMQELSYARIASSTASALLDVVVLVTGPAGWVGSLIKSFLSGIIAMATIELVVNVVMTTVVPQVAEMLTEDLITDVMGEDLGNALVAGSHIYLSKNHQGGGGSPASAEVYAAYKQETESILAEEAEYERRTLSPFDVSSGNTFMGSLLRSLMPLASSMRVSNAWSFGGALTSLAQSSVTKLLPTASALGETRMFTQLGECPNLNSTGAVGDPYCVPYYTSDFSTIELDPGGEVFEYVANKNMGSITVNRPLQSNVEMCRTGEDSWTYSYPTNFKYKMSNEDEVSSGSPACILDVELDSEDNPVIELNSNLGKYIVYCGQRDSQFGLADANISADLSEHLVSSNLSTVLGAVPVLGDLTDAVTAARDIANAPWIGGEACVASESNPLWEENKYYQRYMEDQRLMEAIGMISKSAVTNVVSEYYEENPLDNSYEGVLARMSGLTKEQVVAVLDLMEYESFLAEYDPSNLLPVVDESSFAMKLAEKVDEGVKYEFGVGTLASTNEAVVPRVVMYNDTRNRSFAV